jgi:hypothetical protein
MILAYDDSAQARRHSLQIVWRRASELVEKGRDKHDDSESEPVTGDDRWSEDMTDFGVLPKPRRRFSSLAFSG